MDGLGEAVTPIPKVPLSSLAVTQESFRAPPRSHRPHSVRRAARVCTAGAGAAELQRRRADVYVWQCAADFQVRVDCILHVFCDKISTAEQL